MPPTVAGRNFHPATASSTAPSSIAPADSMIATSITFPFSSIQMSTTGEPSTEAPTERTLRLLIVEDHEATRSALTRLLTKGGHQVVAVATSAAALEAAAAEPFDAIISDLGLPDGSGLDLMRQIRRYQSCPGIALSGYGADEDVRQTHEAGFFAHLVKPVKVEQLRQLLAQLPAAQPS